MDDTTLRTTQLHLCLERMKQGNQEAREELVRGICRRTEHLARKMLRDYPRLGRLVETGDVLQSALMRLLRALEELQPTSMREFFGLAALQIRRELLDLARHYLGPEGYGKRVVDPGDSEFLDKVPNSHDEDSPSELERWTVFHQAVDELPAEEREVVGLIYYHGWTQEEVANLFGASARTIRRRWQDARVKLGQRLRDLKERSV